MLFFFSPELYFTLAVYQCSIVKFILDILEIIKIINQFNYFIK